MSTKTVTDELRATYTKDIIEFLREKYDVDVCQTAAGTVMIPAVDSQGEDRWVKFSIIIPKEATEENGTDGYTLATDYKMKLETKAARKAEKEAESEKRKQKTAAKKVESES